MKKHVPEVEPEQTDAVVLGETDLRGITSDTKRCISIVTLDMGVNERGSETKLKWLVFGAAMLKQARDNFDGRWFLEAYMKDATDFEHDSALALRLPLIGLRICRVRHQHTIMAAWVDPNEDVSSDGRWAEFHVPRAGYDPTKHPEACVCKTGQCKSKPHPMVPPGFYVPPFDLDLYMAVRGKKVEITLGLTDEDGGE